MNYNEDGGGGGGEALRASPAVERIPGVSYEYPGKPSHTHNVFKGLYEPHVKVDSQELLETWPRVRYSRPDVTDTRGTSQRPLEEIQDWRETNLSFGFYSRTPDLACSVGEDIRGTSKDAAGGQGWMGTLQAPEGYQEVSASTHDQEALCVVPQVTSVEARLSDALGQDPWRLSRSLEDLPSDIQEHILKCQCTCDHLGYGNFSSESLAGLTNGCSIHLTKTSAITHLAKDDPKHDHAHLQHDDLQHDPHLQHDHHFQHDHHLQHDHHHDHHHHHHHDHHSSPTNQHKGEGSGLGTRSKVWVCVVLVLAALTGVGVGVPLALRVDPGASLHQRLTTAKTLLRNTPLFDGHNDLPWNIRKFMHNKLHSFNFTAELKKLRPWSRSSWSHTDLPRLKEGMVGAQFWVSYVPCESQRLNAVQLTIEQIDLIKRLIDQYPDDLRLATSADEVEEAFKNGRIASLIGVEGGHAIQNSLGVLRALRDLGVRYLTLTHTCSTPWAECARQKESDEEDPTSPRGLTQFGKTVVKEMNRLGLMVDLSHVSQATMKAALEVSRAPVIFSHSSVYSICKNPRNVPDHILKKVASKGGVVMISFYNYFLTCSKEATIGDVIEHINHVRKVAGIDHVGIGADFDGINMLPVGLEDVSGYPRLFAELLSDPNWSLQDLRKLAGHNLLRVMRDVERVRVEMQQQRSAPYEEEINKLPADQQSCFYRFTRPTDDVD